ncbi:hypothetical protein, partial [Klebsiella pneumoniae]|uniref:hypothetical protein n=1 Tax=Klebsiella pneumoniae TaxID=573 RepID=UPI0027318C86
AVSSAQVLFSLPQPSASSGRVLLTRGNYEPEDAIDIGEPPTKRARMDPMDTSNENDDVLIRTSVLGQYMFNCKEMSPLELFNYFETQRH